MPSSLTEDRSSTFGEFPEPTSVGVRYGSRYFHVFRRLEAFLGGLRISRCFRPLLGGSPRPLAFHWGAGFAWLPAARRTTGPVRSAGHRSLPRPPLARGRECRTLHLLSIAYARYYEPRLRSRLTLGRLPLPRNPQACGGVGSHHPFTRYSFRHSRFGSLHQCSRPGFIRYSRTLPYHP